MTRPLAGFVSIPVEAQLTVSGVAVTALTHPMTPSVHNLTAEVVRVPFLESPEELTGKIVLFRGFATEKPVSHLEAEALGAVAVIFITGPLIHNMIVSKRWGSPDMISSQRTLTPGAPERSTMPRAL